MSSFSITDTSLIPELERVLQQAIHEEVNKAADEAADKIRAAIRERLGNFALNMLREYAVERHGSNLIITVKMKPENSDA
jgi:hypothetical protein